MKENDDIRSPEELRALNETRIAKENATIEAAKQIAYHCVYKEINKHMAAHSSLEGVVELHGECLNAFKVATRRLSILPEHRERDYGRNFDYTPFGWKKAIVGRKYSDRVWFRFE